MATNINDNNRELLRLINSLGSYLWEINFYCEGESFNNLTPSKLKRLKEFQGELRENILKIK